MFIQTDSLSDPDALRFVPGEAVLPSGKAEFPDPESSRRSPLARRLFAIDGVTGVSLEPDSVTVGKRDDKEWHVLKPAIFRAIMEHFASGRPALGGQPGEAAPADPDGVIAAELMDFLDARIRPTVADEGGKVAFAGFADGVLTLELGGAGFSTPLFAVKVRIENTVRRDFPEVEEVRFADVARPPEDTSDKPGMQTPEAEAIQKLLAEQINPAVAAHGGHISLVDVQDDTVYIRLEGGCQGCGMADVTLKQGIEEQIKQAVPEITTVLDVTDHAGGTNPYFQPGKMDMSPFSGDFSG
jgi:Fe-S cluster biogenesis protein NfuA